MFALILSICMSPINPQGQVIGPETCEESVIAEHKTITLCTKNMDKQTKAIENSILAPFDWQVACEALQPRKPIKNIIYVEEWSMFTLIDVLLQLLSKAS